MEPHFGSSMVFAWKLRRNCRKGTRGNAKLERRPGSETGGVRGARVRAACGRWGSRIRVRGPELGLEVQN